MSFLWLGWSTALIHKEELVICSVTLEFSSSQLALSQPCQQGMLDFIALLESFETCCIVYQSAETVGPVVSCDTCDVSLIRFALWKQFDSEEAK